MTTDDKPKAASSSQDTQEPENGKDSPKDTPQQDDTPKSDSKHKKLSAQDIRDAHYHENGVKADGSGGNPPESEQ